MKKVDIELVKAVMQRKEIDVRMISQVLEEIQIEQNALLDEQGKTPPVKKQCVIIISDPKGELVGKDLTGWVVKIPEEDSPFVAEERIFRAAYEYNVTPKGRRMPVRTVSEVCEFVPPRVTTEQNLWIATKEPVYVLRTDGRVPTVSLKSE